MQAYYYAIYILPKSVSATITITARMSSPSPEFNNPIRLELITKFAQHLYSQVVNAAAWLFLWFADLDSLRSLTEKVEKREYHCMEVAVPIG